MASSTDFLFSRSNKIKEHNMARLSNGESSDPWALLHAYDKKNVGNTRPTAA